jgi:hypothetical protein
VYPETQEVVVYSSPTESLALRGSERLQGGDLLPGFSVPVNQLFAELRASMPPQ